MASALTHLFNHYAAIGGAVVFFLIFMSIFGGNPQPKPLKRKKWGWK